jgi:hypothetical protein
MSFAIRTRICNLIIMNGALQRRDSRGELGACVNHSYDLDNSVLTAELMAAWMHQLDNQPLNQASFDSLSGAAFQLAGMRPDGDDAAGVELQVQNRPA